MIVFFVMTAITLTIMSVVIGLEMSAAKKIEGAIEGAVGNAVNNDRMCNVPGVVCSFTPDTTITPPPVANTGHPYSVPTAAFGAQVVAILEEANKSKRAPVPPSGTVQLALLSTSTDANLAWVLQTADTKQVWIAFRGTQSAHEWKEDFDLAQVPFQGNTSGVLVHRGFSEIYASLKAKLRAAIAQVPLVLFITGHSLGAGVAALCSADLGTSKVVQDIRTYLFAPPRSGNQAFVDMVLNGSNLTEFYAVGNFCDIVPTLPLAVEPNWSDSASPWLYAQFPLMMFSANWGSWELNHVMPVYIQHLGKVQLCT